MKTVKKPWGVVKTVLDMCHIVVEHATVNAGGESSYGALHRHLHKGNGLYVVSGILILFTEDNPGGQRMGPGDEATIPVGVWHRFEAITNVEMIETYWGLHGVDPNDIERQEPYKGAVAVVRGGETLGN